MSISLFPCLLRLLLRSLLLGHPKVTPDPARVRFIGMGTHSLDLEVFAYLRCQDQNTFLAIQEDLLMRAIGIVNAVHERPLDEVVRPEMVVQVFAARAGAELERRRAEAELERQRIFAESLLDMVASLVTKYPKRWSPSVPGAPLRVNRSVSR